MIIYYITCINRKALFTESNEQDDISLNMKHINVSSLISPHINKHLLVIYITNIKYIFILSLFNYNLIYYITNNFYISI